MAALVPVTLHMLSNMNWSLCLNSCPIVEGWALICTTFSGQTVLSLGYSQKHCSWCDCQARGGAWSQYTQLLLTPSALVITGKTGKKWKSCYSSTQHLFGQDRCHHTLLLTKLLWAELLKYLLLSPCLSFHPLFLSFFSTRLWEEQIFFSFIFFRAQAPTFHISPQARRLNRESAAVFTFFLSPVLHEKLEQVSCY